MAGLRPLFSARDIDRFYEKFTDKADGKMYDMLVFAGEEAVKRARDEGKYNDITGNLRSSIGYVILKGGRIIKENYEVRAGGEKGEEAAQRLVKTLARQFNQGFGLIIVAGMDYAVFVENMENKDVLSGAVIGTEKYIRETLEDILE